MLTLLLLGVLLGPEAQAYYNSTTGRWLSRDPVGEREGLNLYGFGKNDLQSMVDTDGRAILLPGIIGGLVVANVYYWNQALKPLPDPNPPAEMFPRRDCAQNFIVHKCTIVIVLGHADFDRPHRFIFDKGFESCSGAGVTGCGSGGSNAKIPPAALIPGTPHHTDEILTSDPAYVEGVVNTRNGAITKAGQICKDPKKCCTEVRIYYFDAPKNDRFEDTVYQNKKPMIEIYDCKAGRITKTMNNHFLDDRSK